MGLSNPVLSGFPCSAFERQLEARERVQLMFSLRTLANRRSL